MIIQIFHDDAMFWVLKWCFMGQALRLSFLVFLNYCFVGTILPFKRRVLLFWCVSHVVIMHANFTFAWLRTLFFCRWRQYLFTLIETRNWLCPWFKISWCNLITKHKEIWSQAPWFDSRYSRSVDPYWWCWYDICFLWCFINLHLNNSAFALFLMYHSEALFWNKILYVRTIQTPCAGINLPSYCLICTLIMLLCIFCHLFLNNSRSR